MKKKGLFLILCFLLVFSFSFSSKVSYADNIVNEKVYLGGIPAGFTVFNKGAYVNGFRSIITENGIENPCKDSGIAIGDVILSINNVETNNALDIEKSLNNSDEKILTVKRNGEVLFFTVKPSVDVNGNIKLGLFIRDGINGIGTITYIKGTKFASLGHPILDENNNIVEINGGNLYNCNITGVIKGVKGRAGELKGVLLKEKTVGQIEKNLINGVYGQVNKNFIFDSLEEIEFGTAKIGDAKIVCTLYGCERKYYDISIVKIDKSKEIKNLVIKIEDEKLLETAGGIVQGLSGSPIIQNGKLVGAVTHVFINDPSRGFGILVNKMYNN